MRYSTIKIRNFLKNHPGIFLLILNTTLAFIFFIISDPFRWFEKTYRNSPPLVPVPISRITSIEIQDPESGTIVLKKNGDEYVLEVPAEGESYRADRERTEGLLTAIENSRKYYSIPYNHDRRSSQGLSENQAIEVIINNEHSISIGRVRNAETYILKGEKVYIVQSDLRNATGPGQLHFFRNRQVFGPNSIFDIMLNAEDVTGIRVSFPSGRLTDSVRRSSEHRVASASEVENNQVEIIRSGALWQMIAPLQGSIRQGEIESLLAHIAEWRVRSFLEQLPDYADDTVPFRLEIHYRDGLEQKDLAFNIEAVDGSNYYIRPDFPSANARSISWSGEEIIEIHSVYLEDFLSPELLLDRSERLQ